MANAYYRFAHLLNFKVNKELREIYTSVAFRAFAFGLVGIFIPVYLYKLNYSFTSIFMFFVYYYIAYIIFAALAGYLSRYVGVKHLMFFSIPPVIVFFVLFLFLKFYQLNLIFPALALGISSSFYWIGYHVEFAKFSSPDSRGGQVGMTNIAASVLALFAPAIGGILIAFGGFPVLFITVLLVFTLSTIPLFMSKDCFTRKRINFSNILKKKSLRRDVLPYVAEAMLGVAYAYAWPLIVFLLYATEYETLGILFTVASFCVLVFTYLAGRLDDAHKNIANMLRLNGFISALTWIGRLFISGLASLFFIEALSGVTRPFWVVPVGHYFYERALKSGNLLEYVVFKESVAALGCILFFVILIIFQDIMITPIVSAASSLLFLLM